MCLINGKERKCRCLFDSCWSNQVLVAFVQLIRKYLGLRRKVNIIKSMETPTMEVVLLFHCVIYVRVV